MKKKNNKLLAVFLVIVCVIAVVFGAGAVYVGDYYHASDSAVAVFADTESYKTEIKNGDLVFEPSEPVAGLIFYPGGKVEHTAYAPLMAKLAEKGILCVLVEMPLRLAVLDMNAADGIKDEYPDIGHWYIGGHSLGGAMAASYVASHTSEFDGLILLGAYSTADISGSGLGVLSVYGSEDGVMNREKYNEYLANLPVGFTEFIIDGGCHACFGDYGKQKGDGEATITADEQTDITSSKIFEFITVNIE